MYAVDINRMRNNKPVLFSNYLFTNWGYSYIQPVNTQEDKNESTIEDYLTKKSDNEYKNYENAKAFVSMKIYLIEEKNTQYNIM